MDRTYGANASNLRGDDITRTVEEQRLIDTIKKFNLNKDKIISSFNEYLNTLSNFIKTFKLTDKEDLVVGYGYAINKFSNAPISDTINYVKFFDCVYSLFITLESEFEMVKTEFVSYKNISELLKKEKLNVLKLYLSTLDINLTHNELSRLSKDANLALFNNLLVK